MKATKTLTGVERDGLDLRLIPYVLKSPILNLICFQPSALQSKTTPRLKTAKRPYPPTADTSIWQT